jgi:Rps23 Pro-64 3,4-dihydroxylase Tpa1-like proline 4-hydroxylase
VAEDYAEEFRRHGRVQIPDLLTASCARTLSEKLQNETRWTVTFNEGDKQCEVEEPDGNLRRHLTFAAWERARTRFQYIYERHALSWDHAPYPDPHDYYAGVVEFLNAPEFLGLMRKITRIAEIASTDGQATLYRPGDFLTVHDDNAKRAKRLVAYVLNMTPVWCSDWGGTLQFIDERGNIAQGYVPAFNVLNIFRVPARHAVTAIAPFGGLRYSITGWLHAD